MAGEPKRSRQTELFGDGADNSGIAAPATSRVALPATSELNAQQRAAVEHGDGPLLVVAGAGTGKTRVITERIRHLLESDPDLPGEAIAGLTFTEKAAAEMKHRVTRAVGERGEKIFLGTFHSFCTNLLIEHDPDLKPIEEVDHWILLRRNLPLLQLERYRKLAEPGHFLSDFVKFFSRCQDELVTPERYDRYVAELEKALQRDARQGGLADDERAIRGEEIARQREIARAYRASDGLLRQQKRLTFGMQLLDAVRALDENAGLMARMRERFRYILVDEFQDTNVAQLELLWRLAGEHRNIVAVGDDAQAIYRFRGASFGSFTIFLEKFAGVAKGDPSGATRFVRPLADNYRSTARVLRVAGQVTSYLEHSPLVPKKELVPHKNLGEKVRIVELGSATQEARWVAAEIARLHGAGLPWRSFAALYRIHAHRDALVMALGERGIPFVIRNLSILNHRLVLDVMAYLRLVARPADDLACARVLAAPAWGLQPSDLVRLQERAAKVRKSLWETLQEEQGELPFGESAKRGTDALIAGVNELRERARKLTAAELFDALADWLEIAVAVEADDRRYVDRLGRFVREWQTNYDWAASAAQTRGGTARLAELMQYLEYFEQAGGKIDLEQDADDAVQLMTVHAAKGLEFDHVFVLRLTKGGFPMSPRASVLEFPEALMQEELPAWDYHTQEERRLFYVALTRARERLTLTTVVHPRSKPSLFLDDILSAPQLAREHVEQSAPKAVAPPAEKPARDETIFADAAKRPRVYSRIADWALEYRPPVFEPLQLSVSAIETYRTCPQKHLFSYVWGIRGGPHAAMTFGNVMHTTIREFLGALRKGRPLPPFEDVEAIFRREWSSAGFEDRYQEECYQKDGLEQLRAFHAACREVPPDIWAQEKAFALELENNVQVTGRIDQVNFKGPLPGPTRPGSGGGASALGRTDAKAGEVEIVDYKTGKPKTEEKARKDLQLGIYALAAREALDLNATLLVYHSLQNNQRVTAGREAKQLAEVRNTIQEVAAEIRAREFPPRPGFYCRGCDYRTLCPAREAGRVLPEEDAPSAASHAAPGRPAGKKPRGVSTRA